MKNRVLMILVVVLLPASALAQENGFSLGYGFAFLNPDRQTGKVFGLREGERNYNFMVASYFREMPLFKTIRWGIEPFVAYVSEPGDGVDVGLNLWLKGDLWKTERFQLYLQAGPGGAYTSTDFAEQGTQWLFILQAGVGLRWKDFFLEEQFRHYSNGGLVSPNRSINANIIKIGFYF